MSNNGLASDNCQIPDDRDACPATPGPASRQGCPSAIQVSLVLQTNGQGGAEKRPLANAEVKVFDRDDEGFMARFGTSLGRFEPAIIFSAGPAVGLAGHCITGQDGLGLVGLESVGNYLVIGKFHDSHLAKEVYVMKAEDSEEFMADDIGFLAEARLKPNKKLKKDGSLDKYLPEGLVRVV